MPVNLTELYKPKIIECNTCHKLIGKLVVCTERLLRNRTGYYFLCDKCGAKYTFAAITSEGESLKKKINKIRNSKSLKDMSKLKKYLDQFQKEVASNYTKEEVINAKNH